MRSSRSGSVSWSACRASRSSTGWRAPPIRTTASPGRSRPPCWRANAGPGSSGARTSRPRGRRAGSLLLAWPSMAPDHDVDDLEPEDLEEEDDESYEEGDQAEVTIEIRGLSLFTHH